MSAPPDNPFAVGSIAHGAYETGYLTGARANDAQLQIARAALREIAEGDAKGFYGGVADSALLRMGSAS